MWDKVKDISVRRPDYIVFDSSDAKGLVYAKRKDNTRILIAGREGETVLTIPQATAVFYEIGDILEGMGCKL